MLTHLLATGVLSMTVTGGPPVATPAGRTIKILPTGGAPTAAQQLGTAEVMDFLLDLTSLLDDDERFDSIELRVAAASQLQGFMLLQSPPYAPEVVENGRVRVWPTIDPSLRTEARWQKGQPCQIEVTAVTTSVPPRTWQGTAQITAVRK